MAGTWQLARADIGLRCWDDGCIAYQPLSGETHMLARPAGRLIERLRQGDASAEALLACLDGRADAEEGLADAVQRWLRQLADARLIRQTPS